MSAPRLSFREQRLVWLTALVLISGGVATWGILPQWRRVAELREGAALSSEKLQRLQALLQRQADIESDYQRAAALLSDEDPEAAQRRFLDELDAMAQQVQLHLDLKPRPIQTEDAVSRVSVEIDAQATQEALLAFLDALLTQPAPLQLERLRISTSASAEAPLRANLVVTRLLIRPIP